MSAPLLGAIGGFLLCFLAAANLTRSRRWLRIVVAALSANSAAPCPSSSSR